MSGVSLRQFTEEDIDTVVDWTSAEGWQVSRNIILACYKCDPHGWIAADYGNKLVGCIAGCILDNEVASGGFFIVGSALRGKGIGRMLWEARLRYIGRRNLCITAVENRVESNLRHGFQYTSFTVLAFMGSPLKEKMELSYTKGFHLLQYEQSYFKDLFEYDTQIHTVPREAMLRQWISTIATITFVVYRKDKIIGYGCIQPVIGGNFHIGPVFADTPAVAESLFTKLFELVPQDKKVGFDIPEDNELAMDLAKRHQFCSELKLVRMCNRAIVLLPMDRVYSITSCGVSLV